MRLHPIPMALAMVFAIPASPPVSAQAIATSSGPGQVGVTIYRDPERPAERPMQLSWLNGYALITETRTIAIPEGTADIRFEGVAGGIIPESAIVTGLPDGAIEKNQDAYLLSPASLLDRSLGQRVQLRRTSTATGSVREQEAIVRTAAEGAVLLQTADGLEALRCTGLNETMLYDNVPQGLSARPTLSVRTRSSAASTATVTLSYLATGFDWQANYIATLNPAGNRLDLFAWVTLASSDETSFVRAEAQTVAGKPNREQRNRVYRRGGELRLQCWPAGTTTSDLYLKEGEQIIVTGSRVGRGGPSAPPPAMAATAMEAQQEDLGDLKLYRIPEPVTIASHSQKQVAMLQRRGVKVRQVYRTEVSGAQDGQYVRAIRVLKTRNRASEGLGLPLPAGGVVLFASGHERPILIGRGAIDDHAVGEDVEIEVGVANGVFARLDKLDASDPRGNEFILTITNPQDRKIDFEAVFEGEIASGRKVFAKRNGRTIWSVRIPARRAVTLRYRGVAPR